MIRAKISALRNSRATLQLCWLFPRFETIRRAGCVIHVRGRQCVGIMRVERQYRKKNVGLDSMFADKVNCYLVCIGLSSSKLSYDGDIASKIQTPNAELLMKHCSAMDSMMFTTAFKQFLSHHPTKYSQSSSQGTQFIRR